MHINHFIKKLLYLDMQAHWINSSLLIKKNIDIDAYLKSL